MLRQTILSFFIVGMFGFPVYADMEFSIRYYDKNIYYSGDTVEIMLTLSNVSDNMDESFYLADDPRQSFGFNLQNLTGAPAPLAEGYVNALNTSIAYRSIHLAPGQTLSLVVDLNDWLDPSEAEQYQLSAYFYPQLRGQEAAVIRSDSILNLTVLPKTNMRWHEKLDDTLQNALRDRNLDPWNVVRESLIYRAESQFNRATLYLDTIALTQHMMDKTTPASLESSLLEGDWDKIPGFQNPVIDIELISSRVYPEEAVVRVMGTYEPLGERFERDLRFYLHRKNGYWSIRRIEALTENDADPEIYGSQNLAPTDVVQELIRAVNRGDWDIALQYFDIAHLVRNLPEYNQKWHQMSASEHDTALNNYRKRLISGQVEWNQLPLAHLEDWSIASVNYTNASGSVVIHNKKEHMTAAGPLNQETLYTFRLEHLGGVNNRWVVVQYETTRLGG